MAREALCLGLCAALLFGPTVLSTAGRGEESDARIRNQLAYQNAFEKGLQLLERGNFAEAVAILEAQLPYIDGNRRYLTALRDAYKGHIAGLQKANRLSEARLFLTRLEILDPAARRDIPTTTPPTSPPPASQAPTSVAVETPIPRAPEAVVPAARPLAALASESGSRVPADRVVAGGAKPVVALGKADEDPFDASNSVQNQRAVELLDRAERAYAARRFEEAGSLFEQAYRSEPNATRDSRGRWAYCKLFVVAEQLNKLETPVETDLEQEVRTALSMAPREMDSFGKDLLKKLAERAESGPKVEVKHTPRPGGTGWAVAETGNFRIFHTQTRETAEKAAQIAEATRSVMTRKWFGDGGTEAWSPRCDIYLHGSGKDYARATGAPAESPGHSTLSLDAGRVITRRIDLRADDKNMLVGVLPHETTHVVLAGRFGVHHVPRWADEGMAVLAEPRERVNLHLRNLPVHQRQGDLFAVGQLMEMDKYPEPRRVGAFYAESVSLVDFLSRRKGPQVFANFLREGLEHGYDGALRKHYDINGSAELDRLWRDHALGAAGVAAAEKP
jgi:tetratricopeptide (TPR) repeat protein